MSKNIRQKIVHAIQTTFRSSPPQTKSPSSKSKISSCCSVTKPQDYEFISYQPKQSSNNNDYIDLSECHSSYSRDSGISLDSTHISSISDHNIHPLQSTRTLSTDDPCSLSTFSHLSSIPHDHVNISHFDISTPCYSLPQSFQCCHCQCHHHHHVTHERLHNKLNDYLYVPEQHRTKHEVYPFIF